MSVHSGAGAILSVAHHDEAGRLHGHTYEVIAWVADGGGDALDLQRELVRVCSDLDHKVLPQELARAEAIAAFIQRNTGADEVEVNRPLERLYARAK